MIVPNYDFRAVTNDVAERRAVEQSFAQSAIWGFTAEAESNGHVLVDATDFVLRDAVRVGSRLKGSKQGNYSFDKNRSAIYLPRTKNFPNNTEIEATITLVNNDGETGNYVGAVTPSPDAVTLRIHHSLYSCPIMNFSQGYSIPVLATSGFPSLTIVHLYRRLLNNIMCAVTG